MTIGILALQGDVREHAAVLGRLGVDSRPVRRPDDLDGLDGLVIPGGESTTLSLLLESSGLFVPLVGLLGDGLPVLGTCAGLVLLAARVLDGRADQRHFGVLDCTVRRNGYGRQQDSFESPVLLEGSLAAAGAEGDGSPVAMHAVFIRAPVIEAVGPAVEVVARLPGGGPPVACRQGSVLATAFHPELAGDLRIHRALADAAGEAPGRATGHGQGTTSTAR